MQPKGQIVITMNADGSVSMSAPFPNKVLCYGLLETAKDMIREFKAPTIEQPTAEMLPRLLGDREG